MVVVVCHGYLFCFHENSPTTQCYHSVIKFTSFDLFIKKLIKFP